MAAPVNTPRLTPAPSPMGDGFPCFIAFNLQPAIQLWEKTVKPPGMDGGDAVDTTTMHNQLYRTRHPRFLTTLTDAGTTAAYNAGAFLILLGMVNAQQSVTVHFPDGDMLDFWGFMKSFEPNDIQEGSQPDAAVVVICTNWDPVHCVEAAPMITNGTGTYC